MALAKTLEYFLFTLDENGTKGIPTFVDEHEDFQIAQRAGGVSINVMAWKNVIRHPDSGDYFLGQYNSSGGLSAGEISQVTTLRVGKATPAMLGTIIKSAKDLSVHLWSIMVQRGWARTEIENVITEFNKGLAGRLTSVAPSLHNDELMELRGILDKFFCYPRLILWSKNIANRHLIKNISPNLVRILTIHLGDIKVYPPEQLKIVIHDPQKMDDYLTAIAGNRAAVKRLYTRLVEILYHEEGLLYPASEEEIKIICIEISELILENKSKIIKLIKVTKGLDFIELLEAKAEENRKQILSSLGFLPEMVKIINDRISNLVGEAEALTKKVHQFVQGLLWPQAIATCFAEQQLLKQFCKENALTQDVLEIADAVGFRARVREYLRIAFMRAQNQKVKEEHRLSIIRRLGINSFIDEKVAKWATAMLMNPPSNKYINFYFKNLEFAVGLRDREGNPISSMDCFLTYLHDLILQYGYLPLAHELRVKGVDPGTLIMLSTMLVLFKTWCKHHGKDFVVAQAMVVVSVALEDTSLASLDEAQLSNILLRVQDGADVLNIDFDAFIGKMV